MFANYSQFFWFSLFSPAVCWRWCGTCDNMQQQDSIYSMKFALEVAAFIVGFVFWFLFFLLPFYYVVFPTFLQKKLARATTNQIVEKVEQQQVNHKGPFTQELMKSTHRSCQMQNIRSYYCITKYQHSNSIFPTLECCPELWTPRPTREIWNVLSCILRPSYVADRCCEQTTQPHNSTTIQQHNNTTCSGDIKRRSWTAQWREMPCRKSVTKTLQQQR